MRRAKNNGRKVGHKETISVTEEQLRKALTGLTVAFPFASAQFTARKPTRKKHRKQKY